MAKYEYTLQPIDARITPDEFRAAQMEMFAKTNQPSKQTWLILAAVSLVGLGGVIYFSGISSVFFWLLLVGVALYFLIKFVGIKWYVKRELAKQEIPTEVTQMKLGLQPHGIVISMPNSMADQTMSGMNKNQRMMVKNRPMNGDIAWKNISDYTETDNFLVVTFKLRGQDGSQVIPKRLSTLNFPIERLKQHLKDDVKTSA